MTRVLSVASSKYAEALITPESWESLVDFEQLDIKD